MGTLGMWSGIVLGTGFLLELCLLFMVFRRRLTAEAWAFPGLLLLYAVRSVLLSTVGRRLPHPAYAQVYAGFTLADLVMQAALAAELLTTAVRGVRHRSLASVAMLLVASGTMLALAALLPARSPVPADRAVLFSGAIFAALFCIAARVNLRGWARSVTNGLAVVAVSSAIAECGKAIAASHRDAHAFVAWSYANGAVYILTLLYWVSVASQRGRRERQVHPMAVQYVRGTI